MGDRREKKHDKTQVVLSELEQLTDGLETKVNVRTKELSESLSKLSRYNQFQEGMTHMIAHDIKSPLMQIVNLEKVGAKDFPYLRHAGITMFRMIENMLTLHKYNTNNMYVNCAPFWVHKVVEDVLRDFVFSCTHKAITVEIIYEHEFEISADIQIFTRVVGNLFSNAFRFSPHKGVVQIKLSTTIDKCLRVSVSNEGPAMDAKARSRIFQQEDFTETENNDKYRSGLGLYLCQMAIKAHKGDIGVDSDGVQGVEFWFVLPSILTRVPTKVHKQIFHTADASLTADDKAYLMPYAQEMSKFKVYETSKIDTVLLSIKPQNAMIKTWVDDVEKACYALDEGKFEHLVKEVS